MSDSRIIKKYPNRRLYDTEESRYITLADIRRLVIDQIDFVVIDKNSQEDITRNILLQVISEQEQGGDPIMSRDFLAGVIRSYGGTMRGLVGIYLEQSLELLQKRQQEFREHIRESVGTDPVELISDITERNYARWKAVQDKVFRILSDVPAKPRDDNDHRDD